MQGWPTFEPSFPSVAMTVLMGICVFGGSVWRAHSVRPFWSPTVLALSLLRALQVALAWYLTFEFYGDASKTGWAWWQTALVTAPLMLLLLGGQSLKARIPAFAILRAKIDAKAENPFPGERYPDKPLDFTANNAS